MLILHPISIKNIYNPYLKNNKNIYVYGNDYIIDGNHRIAKLCIDKKIKYAYYIYDYLNEYNIIDVSFDTSKKYLDTLEKYHKSFNISKYIDNIQKKIITLKKPINYTELVIDASCVPIPIDGTYDKNLLREIVNLHQEYLFKMRLKNKSIKINKELINDLIDLSKNNKIWIDIYEGFNYTNPPEVIELFKNDSKYILKEIINYNEVYTHEIKSKNDLRKILTYKIPHDMEYKFIPYKDEILIKFNDK